MPACKCVSSLYAATFSNPESHSHLSLVDVITVTFNMAVTVEIAVLSGFHVERAVNGARRGTLGAIEGEILTTRAVVTSSNPEVTSKVNMEGSVCEVLNKFTVLQEIIKFKLINLMKLKKTHFCNKWTRNNWDCRLICLKIHLTFIRHFFF